jgi:hypothetical protein
MHGTLLLAVDETFRDNRVGEQSYNTPQFPVCIYVCVGKAILYCLKFTFVKADRQTEGGGNSALMNLLKDKYLQDLFVYGGGREGEEGGWVCVWTSERRKNAR